MRNYCIRKNLLPRDFVYKKLENIGYYETILGYNTHIIHGMKTYMRFEAILKGFPIEGIEGKTYWEFLTKQNYPPSLRDYLYMQKTKTVTGKNLVEVYNEGVMDSFSKVCRNISFMYERRDFYDFRFRAILNRYNLKINSPSTLKKIGDRSKYVDSTKFDIMVKSLKL